MTIWRATPTWELHQHAVQIICHSLPIGVAPGGAHAHFMHIWHTDYDGPCVTQLLNHKRIFRGGRLPQERRAAPRMIGNLGTATASYKLFCLG